MIHVNGGKKKKVALENSEDWTKQYDKAKGHHAHRASCHLHVPQSTISLCGWYVCVCVCEGLLMNASWADRVKGQLCLSARVLQMQPHRNVICHRWITCRQDLTTWLTFWLFPSTATLQTTCTDLIAIWIFQRTRHWPHFSEFTYTVSFGDKRMERKCCLIRVLLCSCTVKCNKKTVLKKKANIIPGFLSSEAGILVIHDTVQFLVSATSLLATLNRAPRWNMYFSWHGRSCRPVMLRCPPKADLFHSHFTSICEL